MRRPADTSNMKTTPYWWEAAEPTDIGMEAAVPERADVSIAGAGFAGLSAALTLARAGRSVVVFDAMRAGEGASSRNGGICSGNIKMAFGDMVDHYGFERAVAFYEEGVAARKSLAALIETEAIDCGFQLVGRVNGANRPGDYERMAREAEVMNQHLDLGVEMIPRAEMAAELGTDFYHGLQLRPDIGGVHPALLHRGLLEKAVAAGVTIIAGCRVAAITRTDNGFRFDTERGTSETRDTVVATNGYTDEAMTWLRRRVIPIPSQIIATEELPADTMKRLMPKGRMVGDTRNLYNYYRPSPDGTRIVFSGRRGAHTDDDAAKASHLYRNLTEIFPELEGVRLTHSWWGYTGYTFDFLPKVAINDGIHYATGFCGSGVVWAPWLGKKAAALILGEIGAETIFADYPFQSRPLYYGKPWFLPFVIGWYGVKDWFGAGRRN